MSDPFPFTDTIHRVWADKEHFLEVGEWAEVPKLVELRTTSAEDHEYFGRISVAMPIKFARQLAAALIACADKLEEPA